MYPDICPRIYPATYMGIYLVSYPRIYPENITKLNLHKYCYY